MWKEMLLELQSRSTWEGKYQYVHAPCVTMFE